MLSGVALSTAVGNSPQIPFQGITYRAIHLRYFPTLVAAQPLFTAAGGKTGSRYVAPNGPETLYVALEADTAFREFNQLFLGLATTPLGIQQVAAGLLRPDPFVTLGIHVKLDRLLDLTNRTVRRHLGITSANELFSKWRGVRNAPTQVLGATVFASNRYEGILYPSAQHRKYTCLAVFRQRLALSSRVHFHDTPTNMTAQLP